MVSRVLRFVSSTDRANISSYFSRVGSTKLLALDEEQQLARRISAGDELAREQMVRANLRLVVKVARDFLGRGLDLDDLVQEGNVGLIHAVERFDPSRNTRFSTYASYWIRQAIQRALSGTSRTIRVPAYAGYLITLWQRTSAQLLEELKRAPSDDEVASRLDLSKRQRAILEQAFKVWRCANSPSSDSDEVLSDFLEDRRSENPESAVSESEQAQHLTQLLGQLRPREAAVLRMRFGLDGNEPLTLRDIGKQLGLTRERVRQIQINALRQLKQRMQ